METRTRERRRYLNERIARRRAFMHDALHGDDSARERENGCAHTHPAGWWRKRGIQKHKCRKRKHGYPRADVGLCFRGDRVRVYLWRRVQREVRRLLVDRREDPQCDTVEALFAPMRA